MKKTKLQTKIDKVVDQWMWTANNKTNHKLLREAFKAWLADRGLEITEKKKHA